MSVLSDPLKVISAAIKEVPAVRFALGLAGVAAAASIVGKFVGSGSAAIITMTAMLLGMLFLYIISAITTGGQTKPLPLPAAVVLWAVTLFICAMLFFLTTALAFGWPDNFANTIQVRTSIYAGLTGGPDPIVTRPAAPPNPTPMNRTGAGVFHQALFKQRPLELHGLQVRTENIGTPQGKLFIDIAEVLPNCTPEGANGHVRARLYGETDFDDGSHDTLLLRDFRRNPTNYKSPSQAGPVIGARVPTRIVLVLEGDCGQEMLESLYPGEIAE